MKKICLFIITLAILIITESISSKQTQAQIFPRIPILMYHYIRDYHYAKDKTGIDLSVSPASFNEQMEYLATQGYTPITLDTLYAILKHQAAAPIKPIVLTFDDSYIDFYTNAFPILKKYNFHAVSFVITGFVGKPAYLSWNNIHELQSSGLISFESHTVDHAYLPGLSYNAIVKEVTESKNVLQSQVKIPVNFIAYPSGGSNGTVIAATKKAGYFGGFGTWYGKASYISLNMPRVRVSGNTTLSLFISRL